MDTPRKGYQDEKVDCGLDYDNAKVPRQIRHVQWLQVRHFHADVPPGHLRADPLLRESESRRLQRRLRALHRQTAED